MRKGEGGSKSKHKILRMSHMDGPLDGCDTSAEWSRRHSVRVLSKLQEDGSEMRGRQTRWLHPPSLLKISSIVQCKPDSIYLIAVHLWTWIMSQITPSRHDNLSLLGFKSIKSYLEENAGRWTCKQPSHGMENQSSPLIVTNKEEGTSHVMKGGSSLLP